MGKDDTALPYARQVIDEDDIAAVVNVLRSNYLTTGPVTTAFEKKLSEVTEAPFAVACSSGTAALHLATLALGIGPGDTVIIPAITFLATANVVRYTGAEVLFADVDPDNGLMRPDHLKQALEIRNSGTKAVYPVHLGGQSPNMKEIRDIAISNNLTVVEDASHAIGASYYGANGEARTGACVQSDITTFSFHPVKTIAMGEGGAITTAKPFLADKVRLLLNHGITREKKSFIYKGLAFNQDAEMKNKKVNPWYYEMHNLGFNYRTSDIHCALGLSQLGKLNKFVRHRRALAKTYDSLLAPLAPFVRPVSRLSGNRPAWHLYQVLIDFNLAGISRAEMMSRCSQMGIGTQVHYIPVHRQPYYHDRYGEQKLSGADSFYERCLSLPLFFGMTSNDVRRVVNSIEEILS